MDATAYDIEDNIRNYPKQSGVEVSTVEGVWGNVQNAVICYKSATMDRVSLT